MTGSELRYDDPGSTAAAVELLRRHDAQEPEANITSAVRDFLTSTGLTKPEEIVEENPPSNSSRQAVDLTALDTFLELKQRIGTHGNPHPDHVAQLDGYLKQSEDAGRVRMGILTDGKQWLLRWPQAGPVRTVPPYLFTLESGDSWFRLYDADQLAALLKGRGDRLTSTITRRELRKWLRASDEGKAVETAATRLLAGDQ